MVFVLLVPRINNIKLLAGTHPSCLMHNLYAILKLKLPLLKRMQKTLPLHFNRILYWNTTTNWMSEINFTRQSKRNFNSFWVVNFPTNKTIQMINFQQLFFTKKCVILNGPSRPLFVYFVLFKQLTENDCKLQRDSNSDRQRIRQAR